MRISRRCAVVFACVSCAAAPRAALADPNPCTVTGPPYVIACVASPPTVIPPISQSLAGATGSDGSVGFGFPFPKPPTGGDAGGDGGSTTVVFPIEPGSQAIELPASTAAISIQSLGGKGGDGGGAAGYPFGGGADGGQGGNGGTLTVTVDPNLPVATQADQTPGIWVQSVGGVGGMGGFGVVSLGGGGNGGGGGRGGDVTLTAENAITTVGNSAYGILAESLGGGGGKGGLGALGIFGGGGAGGTSQAGGNVTVHLGAAGGGAGGAILTYGAQADGILAQSIGGFGGSGNFGGFGVIPVTSGGGGNNGGNGQTVTVTAISDSSIATFGDGASGIVAQSLGGGGGEGGNGGDLFGSGGGGAPGGFGGNVFVANAATIATSGASAKGILAQSIGGGGGDGGAAGGVVALGGQGSSTSDGGNVFVGNSGTITTNTTQALSPGQTAIGFGAQDIFAQSVGGGGGNGGGSGGIFTVGGSGGGGGLGGTVAVANFGTLLTNAPDSNAIFAQSVGGGGGNGGGAVGAGIGLSAAIGGSAGTGSNGSDTSVTSGGGSITTLGDRSSGIAAQSVGGGGGNGGFAVSASVGISSAGLAVGGQGGGGGNGSTVEVTNGDPTISSSFGSAITTGGATAHDIFAQSVGGGGGSGGFAVQAGFGLTDSKGFAVGGSGGDAGFGNTVTVKNNASLTANGDSADGILAQSVGGGGGTGAFSVAGNVGIATSSGFSLGGSGGKGGRGGTVDVTNGGLIVTTKGSANDLFAQSVGGGGGDGGFSVTGTVSLGSSQGLSLGGTAGGGGNGGDVTLSNAGALITMGDKANAVVAQSVGGGGGDGGFSVTGGLSVGPGAGVSIGGDGATGGTGGTVLATNLGPIGTMGNDANGLFVQSVGGGGGSGGFSVAGNVSGIGTLDASIGGGGAGGGTGGDVTVNNGADGHATNIMTAGNHANGIEAQSVSGGGGNGAFGIAAGVDIVSAVSLGVGGSGGAASTSGNVSVTNFGNITTAAGQNPADGADAILAQSIAGGGGNGGFSIAGGVAGGVTTSVGVGGDGGAGGTAGTVIVDSTGVLSTNGNGSAAILAQSVGGGGGNGGFNVAGGLAAGATFGVGVGGSGSAAGTGGRVSVTNTGGITTLGNDSDAISAQSTAHGGGNGAFSIAGGLSGGVSADLSVGGGGGDGGAGGNVDVTTSAGLGSCGGNIGVRCPPNIGTIVTTGDRSDGVNAQSAGGGGGKGGFSVAGGALSTVSLQASLGGSGGNGGNGETVFVEAADNITTSGDSAIGINAQSQGGGGGAGGFSIAGGVTTFLNPSIATANLAIGGSGGDGGVGGPVTVENFGSIATSKNHAADIYAQSQGGTGGNGGFSVGGSLDVGLTPAVDLAIGGSGGNGSTANQVFVSNAGALSTTANDAAGIFAESNGGGGGKAGLDVAGGISGLVALDLGIGGGGGNASTGGDVFVLSGGTKAPATINTGGSQSDGIVAESIGGNGGSGGISIAGGIALGATMQASLGGSGGVGATPGVVQVSDFGNITTGGAQSNGIRAQSVGGNGGSGGFSIAGGVSPLVSGSLGIGGDGEGGANAKAATVNFGSLSGAVFGGTIVTNGPQSNGMYAQSVGGGGGKGGFSVAGSLTLAPNVDLSVGGTGGDGGNGDTTAVNMFGDIGTVSNRSNGVLAQSIGGGGGDGGFSVGGALSLTSSLPMSVGGQGGTGGTGGAVNIVSAGIIGTGGDNSGALVGQSIGGGGGSGGFSVAGNVTNSKAQAFTVGGVAGNGASAGRVSIVDLNVATPATAPTLFTLGNESDGILAQSVGGSGGTGGFSVGASVNNGSSFLSSVGGLGGTGSTGGPVEVLDNATIFTKGSRSDGIAAQSIGGGGGDGGFSVTGNFSTGKATDQSTGGFGGAAGIGGSVLLADTAASIITMGNQATGVYAESVGGGGGTGGFAIAGALNLGSNGVASSLGGLGGGGGDGGNVILRTGTLTGPANFVGTTGAQADGVLAQSVGGGGGSGGFAIGGTINNAQGLSQAIGGNAAGAGNGRRATLIANTDVATTGNGSAALATQSIGGSGGSGGWTVAGGLSLGGGTANFAIGGKGGGGGNGGSAALLSLGNAIATTGMQSDGLLAQSTGGGGGSGGFSIAGAVTSGWAVGFGLGGQGGGAGIGEEADVGNRSAIVTTGTLSDGIAAQSIGGGGGSGGFAISASGTLGLAGNTSFGGFAAGGNDGGRATVVDTGSIETKGQGAAAIYAESLGGGGGTGGFSIAGGATLQRGAFYSFGGSGGAGGNGGEVLVADLAPVLLTTNANANALEAQSLGGGGGNGGFAIGGALTGGGQGTLAVGFGGDAATGGNGGFVELLDGITVPTGIETRGDNSNGMLAQSVGGGGGAGGFAIGGGISGGMTTVESFGGNGGTGGDGETVYLANTGLILTRGTSSNAIAAQSIGGGGGDGGFSIAGALSGADNASLNLGGGAGNGGIGGFVTALNGSALLHTIGNQSSGLFAQSVGGGGGSGGFSITGAGSLGSRADAASLGGHGGSGGRGGSVSAQSGSATATTTILTEGAQSDGLLVQSVGGGGGRGGFGIEGLASTGSVFGFNAGGFGGTGNNAGERTAVENFSNIETVGASSNGIDVQSIGGGGGSGGFNVTARVAADSAGFGIASNFGFGSGGSGGNGEGAFLANNGAVITQGANSDGVLAQSIGGGGGYGGFSFATQLAGNLGLSEGASNAGGGNGGGVTLQDTAPILTLGDNAGAVVGQSVGGGGGKAGMTISGTVANAGPALSGVDLSLGNNGGSGGNGGRVDITSSALGFSTRGTAADGILGQSIGGGGGSGGFNIAADVSTQYGLGETLGGSGGAGGIGGDVTVLNSSIVLTKGALADGIAGQSIGGGGGDGAFALTGTVAQGLTGNVGFGGAGGVGNDAGNVGIGNAGAIRTKGQGADGILGESIGGGGGSGGFSIAATVAQSASRSIGFGGSGAGAGNGGGVVLVNGAPQITTGGDNAAAIAGQSIGGGGGDGSFAIDGALSGGLVMSFGGTGGAGGYGGSVTILSGAAAAPPQTLSTTGFNADGILAQSLGAGGGNGGLGIGGPTASTPFIGLGVGGNGGGFGDGGAAIAVNYATIGTGGNDASGMLVQSVGGGGGVGNVALTGETNAQVAAPFQIGASKGSAGGSGRLTAAGNQAGIATVGAGAYGVAAQSIGFGGGVAGFDDAGSLSSTGSGGLNLGALGATCDPATNNRGCGSGNAGIALLDNRGVITTMGAGSDALLAQSIAGGGGAGNLVIASDFNGTTGALLLQEGGITVGGLGGTVLNENGKAGVVTTHGFHSDGLLAQSIGGGGGDGTISVGGALGGGSALVAFAGGTGNEQRPAPSGTGGGVLALNLGRITTLGDLATALAGQSVGGGGGSGGIAVAGAIAPGGIGVASLLGGQAVDFASGGPVAVINNGSVGTGGADSEALFAQSVGGGGGAGALTGALQIPLGDKTFALSALGAIATAQSAGGAVGAANRGTLSTQGTGSTAFLAQSIGGGGGEAGYGLHLQLGTSGAASLGVVEAGLGTANPGGNVTAFNAGSVTTAADNARGLLAQSVGGGGGDAGFAASGTLATSGSPKQLVVSAGGRGGSRDDGGTVTVTGGAAVRTLGNGADAIVAQSIGAGGGNAELAFKGAFSKGTPSTAAVTAGGLTLGSGNGAAVSVNNTGPVSTGGLGAMNGAVGGDFATGMLAQSIGGGGGSARLGAGLGIATTASTTTGSFDINVGGASAPFGGFGGSTGIGGAVSLSDSGSLGTVGGGATGLEAQSIGDGGGNGEANVFGTGPLGDGATAATYALDVSVGGAGGGIGNVGNAVTLAHRGGTIDTAGDAASAILAQSIGGGGGSGGSAHSIVENAPDCSGDASTCTARDVALTVAVGGSGAGQSNDGGDVMVNNQSDIATTGLDAGAIVAQSIGGGGGIAGDDHAASGTNLQSFSLTVGGSKNSGGNGNAVDVTDAGAIDTRGAGSHGVFAQSIGGGGGAAGAGVLGATGVVGTIALGGASGANGNGGSIAVTMNNGTTGRITTMRAGAFGIFAQSIGGGGGVAGDIDNGIGKTLIGSGSALTATGGGGGSAGDVAVTVTGNIETNGNGSEGIFAQSAGGGGGLAGVTSAGNSTTLAPQSFAGSAGGAGNGGNVSVNQHGIIATKGNGADAIFAQSVGGMGPSGNVNVIVNGLALAYGNNADGITAQSLGGAGNGAVAVTITAGSTVQGGLGAGSSGVRILGGNLFNTLDNFGTITTAATPVVYPFAAALDRGVQSSSSSGAADAGHAAPLTTRRSLQPRRVAPFVDAPSAAKTMAANTIPASAKTPNAIARNTLELDTVAVMQTSATSQSLSTASALFTGSNVALSPATAVYAKSAALTLNNFGSILGSIVMSGGTLDLNNHGVLVMGSHVDLGSAGTLMLGKGSLVTPGGAGYVATTNLTGNLTETAGSRYLVTLDLDKGTTSRLNVTGSAALGGALDVYAIDSGAATPGRHVANGILTAAGALTNQGLAGPANTAVATYGLSFGRHSVALNTDIDYAPRAGRLLGANDLAFGDYLGRIALAGGSPRLTSFMENVVAIPTVDELKAFYDHLGSGGSVALSSAALLDHLQFSNALFGCRDDAVGSANTNCTWGTLAASNGAQTATFDGVGYAQHGTGLSAGFQHAIGNGRTSIGAGLRYTDGGLGEDASGTSFTGSSLAAGVSAKQFLGDGTALSANLVGGAGSYMSARYVSFPQSPTQAGGNQSIASLGAHLRAEHRYGTTTNAATPFVDFGATTIHMGALDESGAGPFDERVAAHAQTFPTLGSGILLETAGRAGNTSLRALLSLSVTQLLGDARMIAPTTLEGAPSGVAPFLVTNALDRTRFNVSPSLALSRKNELGVRLGASYDFSSNSHNLGGYIQIGTKL